MICHLASNSTFKIRETKMISMFPVGLVTEFMLTTPVVRNGAIVEFYDGWNIRKYAVDMAEFAVNIEFLLTRPKAYFVHEAGWQETAFLKMLEPFDFKDIQPMANNCTQVGEISLFFVTSRDYNRSKHSSSS